MTHEYKLIITIQKSSINKIAMESCYSKCMGMVSPMSYSISRLYTYSDEDLKSKLNINMLTLIDAYYNYINCYLNWLALNQALHIILAPLLIFFNIVR